MPPSLPNSEAIADKLAPSSVSGLTQSEDRRRRLESAVLASISLGGVWWLRVSMESPFLVATEFVLVMAFSLLIVFSKRDHNRSIGAACLLATPLIVAIAARRLGYPSPFEMTAISLLGAGSLTLALNSNTRRNLALSVVTSGFLVLFTSLISDGSHTLILALTWITVCLWHLVANHWQRVNSCTPESVRRSSPIGPAAVAAGLCLFGLGGWAIHGHFRKPQHLTWGFMPTSGGSSWSDPAARSGVGSGDAAIAAKDHAESFGAVESELFLESTESTLYDMFSDSLGQPKLKQKWERRQGMTPEKLIHAHQRTAKSERGGSSFSTSRTKPKPLEPLRDAHERAVLQWIGPTGIRLAMQRHDTFDGVDWTQQTSWKNEKLARVLIDDEIWFFDPSRMGRGVTKAKPSRHAGVLKVLRLDSTRIPSPMMASGVHIKDIDRADFFGIDHDGSLHMPARVKIPALTVLHLASTSVMEDELLEPNSLASLQSHTSILASLSNAPAGAQTRENEEVELRNSAGQKLAGQLASELTADLTHPYLKLTAIVDHLRREFTFDRMSVDDGDDPLHGFLMRKRGGDDLFATAAAVMGREIGINTRIVSGFYVRPSALDIGQGHSSVVPEDVHVWVEVQLDDGRWIEVEPTPGYRQPVYTPSGWLVAKRFAATHWPIGLLIAAVGTIIYLTRVIWFELLVRLTWSIGRLFPDRQRVRVLLWILQQRGRFAGRPRHTGLPQRDWILSLTRGDENLAADALACCDAADRMVFGGKVVDDWSAPANLLVRKLTTLYISRGNIDDTSRSGSNA